MDGPWVPTCRQQAGERARAQNAHEVAAAGGGRGSSTRTTAGATCGCGRRPASLSFAAAPRHARLMTGRGRSTLGASRAQPAARGLLSLRAQKDANDRWSGFRARNPWVTPRIEQATVQNPTGLKDFADGFNRLTLLPTVSEEEQRAAQAVADKVIRLVQRMESIKVPRTLPAGSWGRRTLVTEAFDIDLVLYVSEYGGKPVSDLELWREAYTGPGSVARMRRDVKDALQRADPSWSVEIANDAHYGNVLRVLVGGMKMDLMLLPELVSGTQDDPVWAQHVRLARPLFADPGAAEYDQVRERADGGALVEYVKSVNDDVKSVMRWVKGLYKGGVLVNGLSPGGDEHIRSFSLEVLVLAAHQRLRQGEGGQHASSGSDYKLALFRKFLEVMVAAVRTPEVVTVNAGKWGYSHNDGVRFAHCWRHGTVRIIHPIDPTCNLERPRQHRDVSDWTPYVALAERLLALLQRGGTFRDFVMVPEVSRALQRMGGM
ncbi:hypothetical protein CHLRE_06g307700v5 [Chlamydomonas reinhardtii]|uniref:Polymerase nucleotidyl transferase domain-containing protein n=1 Tax=Chlamydomonas reinhardtii TaxID=3055 RepID=A0A2K3DRJ2_CHLRE|nr:uncharacterized protein CHLRE_06g307700v5 [Chlamydomonas reinhardtii]PNW83127.1 hypothetical protein CHLRE_06g307700v5 [Chlamydomonas reinhardtii]